MFFRSLQAERACVHCCSTPRLRAALLNACCRPPCCPPTMQGPLARSPACHRPVRRISLVARSQAHAGREPAPAAARGSTVAAPAAASPAATTADSAIELDAQPGSNGSKFVWTRNWYPLAALDCLDPSRPTQLTVLGYNLAIWQDGEGQWRCFRDACPHRAAPLSEGRIHPKTKNLECAYHGWQFAGDGSAQEIPQSAPGAPKATACASSRSCASSYPTATAHGLLWVWLEPGAAGRAAAAEAPLPELPSMDQQGREWFSVSTWYIRDVEVDFLPLMENSCDPSHVHFTHAGFIGAPERAGPITVRLVQQDGGVYRFLVDDEKKASFRNLVLQPPCMLWASSEEMSDQGELALLYFVVPVAPGKSRYMSLVLSTNKKVFGPLAKLFHWQPWLRHLSNHDVAAQDIAVLHRQGTNMASPDFPSWRKGFFLATGSDAGVAVLHKWLEQVAGGGVAYGPNVALSSQPIQPEMRREVLFDTYHQHTEHCPHCQKALRGIRTASAVLAGAAGAAFLGLAYLWGRGAAPLVPASLALLAGMAAALAGRAALQKLERKFHFSDWRHADHH